MLSENDLIKGCQECNIKAQEALYKLYSRKMNAICFQYTGSLADAEDVLHEGFIKIFAKIRQYKGEGSFEGWMRRIMANMAIDYIRDKKKMPDIFSYPEGSELLDVESKEELSFDDEDSSFTHEEIMAIVNLLPLDYRIIFTMSCVEQFSHKEIADRLSIQESTSRSKLRRARNMLRELLEKLAKSKREKNLR